MHAKCGGCDSAESRGGASLCGMLQGTIPAGCCRSQSDVEQAQQRHYAKWPILGINVGTPEVDYQPNSYDGEIIKFKNWITTRLAWLDANMPGNCPDVGIVSNIQPSAVRIFPNPASNIVFIESDKIPSKLELFNMTGQVVYSSYSEIPESIDLNNYSGGLYFVKLDFTDGSTSVRKLIIEK